MADRTMAYVNLARDVRRVWEALNPVAGALVELRHSQLASEATDLEVQLLDLHHQILQLALQSPATAAVEDRSGPSNYGLPF